METLLQDDTELIESYRLEQQIGFILRKASQHHAVLFNQKIPYHLTSTQFAVLAKLYELGHCSQNHLGRLVAVDVVTTKGVVSRLKKNHYLTIEADMHDRRRVLLRLTALGRKVTREAILAARQITEENLKPLTLAEREQLIALLTKLG